MLERRTVDERQAGGGVRQLRDGDRTVEGDDRARRHGHELVVEEHDLPPAGAARLAVHRLHRSLQLVRAEAVAVQATAHERPALVQLLGVPPRAVLVAQQDEVSVRRDPGASPGVSQEHQCQQAQSLGLVGHELDQHAAEPDRLGAQVVAGHRGRAGGEHETDDGEDGARPVGQVCVAGHPVGDAGVADLALGAHQPLRHRRLGHEERPGDLLGAEPAEQAQRERHLRLDGQGGVAAGEDEPQPVVAHGSDLHRVVAHVQEGRLHVSVGAGGLLTQPVDRLAPGRRDDPAHRAGWDAVRGPALHGSDERVLHGLLGDVEVVPVTSSGTAEPRSAARSRRPAGHPSRAPRPGRRRRRR